jgi:hypothetical protein
MSNLFEIKAQPADGTVQHIMLAVPRTLAIATAKYLKRGGCKFTGRTSIHRGGRQEFHIEAMPPKMLQTLIDRTYANGGCVDVQHLLKI